LIYIVFLSRSSYRAVLSVGFSVGEIQKIAGELGLLEF